MSESANVTETQSNDGPTPRQRLVLGLVVREYTRTATPVGSKSLVAQYGLDVSSATVRNDLARLEELGLVRQPHTSAGRVPTEAGYRYFVENIMPERELPIEDRLRIRHQFHQLGLELNQWLQLSAAVLADTVRNAAVVTAPKAPQVRFKHMELVSTYGNAILLVLVLQDGTVRQQGLLARQPLGQEELSNIADRVSATLRGLTPGEIEEHLPNLRGFEHDVTTVVLSAMKEADNARSVEAYHEGFRHLLEQPEFSSTLSARRVAGLLEGDWVAAKMVPQAFAADGITVIIGNDRIGPNAGDFSLVLTRYGVDRELVGALGVLGPTRMQYERVIPAVRYMAHLLTDLVWDLFGSGPAAGR